jgi:hypothetical protein
MPKELMSKHQIKQKMACEMVASNPDITNLELSKQLSLDKKTVSKWRNNAIFIDKAYKRFMEIAGQELPNLLMALIREGKEGNVRAIELALKHWGKLQDTLIVKVEAPFMQHLKAKNGEISVEDVIDVTTEEDFKELPERSSLNNKPIKRARDDNKNLKQEIERTKKKTERNKRYDLRNRALRVDLDPLLPGRPDPSKRRKWLKALEALEKQKRDKSILVNKKASK